ncbi:MAG: MotA/TolQ/ExbB proton channel family protein [Gammaproteobacteria bacterium]|nr:MotA/TolQ/ExbB proton channel family protein [Gammaproteobacteria bacterium]
MSWFTQFASHGGWPVLVIVVGLAGVSVWSWIIIIHRYIALSEARRDLLDFEDQFWGGTDLRELYSELVEEESKSGIERIFVASFREFERATDEIDSNATGYTDTGTAVVDAEIVQTTVMRAARVAVNREEELLETHLGILASVGSVSPYVGLLGTVVGMIYLFRDLANMPQANIASLAPGISSVLIVTAMGLFAAIPAVIAFNRYSARVEILMKRYEGLIDELVSILYRAARRDHTS